MIRLQSQIIVSKEKESLLYKLQELALNEDALIYSIIKDGNFLVSDALEAIQKAYISNEKRVILVLGADNFSEVVQNKLLKIIEEPPSNKEFILIFPTKSMILPTIRSRLPVTQYESNKEDIELPFDIDKLDMNILYEFMQNHKRVDIEDAKKLLQKITIEAIKSDRYNIDDKTLKQIKNLYLALDRGTVAEFALNTLLLNLLKQKVSKKG